MNLWLFFFLVGFAVVDGLTPVQMKKNLGWITVSTIPVECGASVFCNKSPELENMNEDLGKVVNKQEPPKIEPGLIVAAHVVDGENKISFWTRAVVAGLAKNKKDTVDVRMNYLFIYFNNQFIQALVP